MIISLVVAVADNGVIGRGGTLPWRISSDLKTFRRLTMGKPLDGRDNIIVTRNTDYQPEGTIVARDFEAALAVAHKCAHARGADEIAVIGGTTVFEAALPIATRIYKTEVHGNPPGDAYFPPVDWAEWIEASREPLARGPKDDFTATLVVLDRR